MTNLTSASALLARPPVGIYTTHKENMWKVVPPMLIVWGVVGNILTILVVGRQMRRVTSTGIYLLVLAFSDILVLLCAPLRQWILWKWEIDVRNLSQPGCKIHKYLTYASFQFSSWLLVAVTIERAISVAFPYRVRQGCTPKLSTIVLCIIFICIFGLNSHFLYGFGVARVGGSSYPCIMQTASYRQFMEDVWPWIDFSVVFFIPFICLIISNIVIVSTLTKMKRARQQMRIFQANKPSAPENANQTIMIMLVVLSVVFFISMTPVNVYYIVFPYRQRAIDKLLATDPLAWWHAIEYITFWEAIVNIIGYANSSFNFVLYVFSGSRFRAELKALFTCIPTAGVPVFTSEKIRKSLETLRFQRTLSSTLSTNQSFQDTSNAYASPGMDTGDQALAVLGQFRSSEKLAVNETAFNDDITERAAGETATSFYLDG